MVGCKHSVTEEVEIDSDPGDSLNKMHQSEESEVSIRSLLPSYFRQLSSLKSIDTEAFKFELTGQKVLILNQNFKSVY